MVNYKYYGKCRNILSFTRPTILDDIRLIFFLENCLAVKSRSYLFSVPGSHCILTVVWICKIVSITCKYKEVKTLLPIYVTILQRSLFRPGPGSSRVVVDGFTAVGWNSVVCICFSMAELLT